MAYKGLIRESEECSYPKEKQMKDRHHYDKDGNYTGRSSDSGPFDWIWTPICVVIVLVVLSQINPLFWLCVIGYAMLTRK